MSKAEYQAKQFVENTRGQITRLAGVFTIVSGAAAGALAVMDKAANTVAVYKGLSDEMGATAEAIGGLQIAADLSGVALETVSKASVLLTSNLAKGGQIARDAGTALAAINVPLDEFKKLDPVSQLERVAKELAKFEDGAGKTAVAVQLFGRSGAQLIPFLNDLAETGGRQVRLTQEQIEAADQYTKEFARLKSEVSTTARVIIAEAIPAFNGLLTGIRGTLGDVNSLGGNTAIRDFAFGSARALAVLVESLIVVGKGIRAIGGSFEAVFADLQLAGEFVGRGAFGGLIFEKNRQALSEALEKRNKTVQEANKRYVDLWNFDATAISRAIEEAQKQISSGVASSGTTRPALNFEMPDSGGKGKESEAQRYLKSLERTYEAAQELTHYEQLMWDVQEGRLGAVTPKQLEYAISIAKSLDAQKAAAIEAEKQAALDELITRSLERHNTAQDRLNEQLKAQAQSWLDLADPMGKFIRDLEQIDSLVSKGFLDADQAAMIKANMGDPAEKNLGEIDQFAVNAAKSTQAAFSDFLFDPFKDGVDGMAKNFGRVLQRMAADAAAASIMRSLFGANFTKGEWGGLIGGLFSVEGKASGGPVMAGTPYVVGERGPELFMPRSSGQIVPNHALKSGPTINQTINVYGGASKADMHRAAQVAKDQAVAEVMQIERRR